MASIAENIKKLKTGNDKGLRNMSLEALQELAKNGEETSDALVKEHRKADSLLKELNKKRVKLGDGDLNENLRLRQASMVKIEDQARTIDGDFSELEKILQEANKINPASAKESLNKIGDIKKNIGKVSTEKE